MAGSYTSSTMPIVLKHLLAGQHIDAREGPESLYLFDLDALKAGFQSLIQAFPEPHFSHCFAVKAAPMRFVVEEALAAGLGIEAASLLELEHGLRAGCPADKLVFDSPAKTYKEIKYALERGVHLNANCLAELDRIAEVLEELAQSGRPPASVSVGLRINPLIGSGRIEELSVSTITSKFGVTLLPSNRQAILEKYRAYPWLNGLHIHVGSQGFDIEHMASGVRIMVDFAREVEEAVGSRRITVLDIGGGLSANYHGDDVSPTYARLAQLLRETVPELFTDTTRRVVTEFGRSLVAKACWTVSRVEYAFQNSDELRTAIVHCGADSMPRECYCVGKFYHRITAYSSDGRPLEELSDRPVSPHNIAGPLCFAGDVLSRAHPLPRLKAGDWIVIHDTGANTLALFSRHCSRPAPAVLGYRLESTPGGEDRRVKDLVVLQEQEEAEDVLWFWGARKQRKDS